MSLPFDHYALRVADRHEAIKSYLRVGYYVVDEFDLLLEDGSTAKSFALRHPTNTEVFVTSGPEGSKIHQWVARRGGRGAVHHVAYAVESVRDTMEQWKAEGVKFDREEPLECACPTPLVQIFTEEDPTTGLVYELIERNGHPGFCRENVKRLMDGSST